MKDLLFIFLNYFHRIPKGKTPRFPKKPTIRQDGDNLILECILEADPMPDITWYHGTKKIKDGKRHKIQQKSKGAETYLLSLEIKVLSFCITSHIFFTEAPRTADYSNQ